MPSPEEAAAARVHADGARDREELARPAGAAAIPTEVRTKLEDLVDRYRVDELMLTTMVYGQADRLRSYELVAEAWGLSADGRAPDGQSRAASRPRGRPGTTFADSASK